MQLDFKDGHRVERTRVRRPSIDLMPLLAHPVAKIVGRFFIGLGVLCTLAAIGLTALRSQSSWSSEQAIGILVFTKDAAIPVRSHAHVLWIRPKESRMIIAKYPDEYLTQIPLTRDHPLGGLPEFLRLEKVPPDRQRALYSLGLGLPLRGYLASKTSTELTEQSKTLLISALLDPLDTSLTQMERLTLILDIFSTTLDVSVTELPKSLVQAGEQSSFGQSVDQESYQQWVQKTFRPSDVLKDQFTISIQNASGRAGGARSLAQRLSPMGFVPIGVLDAPMQEETKLYVKEADQTSDAVQFLTQILGIPAHIDQEVLDRARADIVIIVGTTAAKELIP